MYYSDCYYSFCNYFRKSMAHWIKSNYILIIFYRLKFTYLEILLYGIPELYVWYSIVLYSYFISFGGEGFVMTYQKVSFSVRLFSKWKSLVLSLRDLLCKFETFLLPFLLRHLDKLRNGRRSFVGWICLPFSSILLCWSDIVFASLSPSVCIQNHAFSICYNSYPPSHEVIFVVLKSYCRYTYILNK